MRSALLAVPVGIVLFLAGLWIGHGMAASGEATPSGLPAANAGASSGEQDILRSISALTEQVQALREQIGSRSTPSETRVPADGSPSDLDKLAESIKELAERLDSIERASRLASGGLVSLRDLENAPGYASREEMLRDVDQVFSVGPLQAGSPGYDAWATAYEEGAKRWQRIHLLWSPQELIERYGRPDTISQTELGPVLTYSHKGPRGQVLGLIFYIRNGLVFSVDPEVRDR